MKKYLFLPLFLSLAVSFSYTARGDLVSCNGSLKNDKKSVVSLNADTDKKVLSLFIESERPGPGNAYQQEYDITEVSPVTYPVYSMSGVKDQRPVDGNLEEVELAIYSELAPAPNMPAASANLIIKSTPARDRDRVTKKYAKLECHVTPTEPVAQIFVDKKINCKGSYKKDNVISVSAEKNSNILYVTRSRLASEPYQITSVFVSKPVNSSEYVVLAKQALMLSSLYHPIINVELTINMLSPLPYSSRLKITSTRFRERETTAYYDLGCTLD